MKWQRHKFGAELHLNANTTSAGKLTLQPIRARLNSVVVLVSLFDIVNPTGSVA